MTLATFDFDHIANNIPARSQFTSFNTWLGPGADGFTFLFSVIFQPRWLSWLRTWGTTSKDPEDNVLLRRSFFYHFPIYVSISLALASKLFATFATSIRQRSATIMSNQERSYRAA